MSEPKPPQDVVLPIAPTDDGKGVRVLRAREDRVEAGEVRPLAEGQPIHGEVVRLKPRQDSTAALPLCDVEVLHAPEKSGTSSSSAPSGRGRPAQVATDTYREHWTEIFGQKLGEKPPPSSALN
jgi:hypothetical protein